MTTPDEHWFDHEKLEVYKESIVFSAWLSNLLESTVRIGDVKDQLDRASNSIALNIAEGNVRMLIGLIKRNSARDYGRHLPS